MNGWKRKLEEHWHFRKAFHSVEDHQPQIKLMLRLLFTSIYLEITQLLTIKMWWKKCPTCFIPAYSFISLHQFKNDAVLSLSVLARLTLSTRRRKYYRDFVRSNMIINNSKHWSVDGICIQINYKSVVANLTLGEYRLIWQALTSWELWAEDVCTAPLNMDTENKVTPAGKTCWKTDSPNLFRDTVFPYCDNVITFGKVVYPKPVKHNYQWDKCTPKWHKYHIYHMFWQSSLFQNRTHT